MIVGTNAAKYPTKVNFSEIFLYATIGLFFVFRPIAISVVISANPNVNASMIYTKIKIPPPYCAAKYGNLHRFPRPIAELAAANTNPSPPENVPLFFSIFLFAFLLNCCRPQTFSCRRQHIYSLHGTDHPVHFTFFILLLQLLLR